MLLFNRLMCVDEKRKGVFIDLRDDDIEFLKEKAAKSGENLDIFIEKILASYNRIKNLFYHSPYYHLNLIP